MPDAVAISHTDTGARGGRGDAAGIGLRGCAPRIWSGRPPRRPGGAGCGGKKVHTARNLGPGQKVAQGEGRRLARRLWGNEFVPVQR